MLSFSTILSSVHTPCVSAKEEKQQNEMKTEKDQRTFFPGLHVPYKPSQLSFSFFLFIHKSGWVVFYYFFFVNCKRTGYICYMLLCVMDYI